MIELLWWVLAILVAAMIAPYLAYVTAKLATYGSLKGRRFFEEEQRKEKLTDGDKTREGEERTP